MADVTLNLIYNDNGAQKNVDNLVRTLQGLETKHYSINVDSKEIQNVAKEAQKLVNELDQLKNRTVSINNAFDGRVIKATFNDLESVAGRFERRISDARQALINFYTTQAAKKNLGLLDDTDTSQKLANLKNNIKLAEEEAKIARSAFENLGKTLDVSGLTGSIDKIAQKMASIGSGIYPENIKSMGDFTSDMTGRISSKFSKMKSSVGDRWKSQFGYYVQERKLLADAMEELSSKSEENKQKIAQANNEISQGYHQTWRGIQQTVTGAINTMTAVYNTWKSVAEAPLNLTGVSTFASMIESMEGSLLLNQISSNIQQGFSAGLERFDILQTFPNVMKSIGYSSAESSDAMNRLYQSVLGLPTAFSDIVDSAKYFALVLDDLDKATDLAIAANNAFVASGANSQQISSGMRQLQYLIDGTKLRSTQWYSLIRSMPIALREVGKAMGYVDFPSFTADLMANKVATEDLIDALIDVGLNSEKIGNIIDVMKSRVTAAMDNVRNAAARMGDTLLTALDTALRQSGGKGIAENIKGVSSIIDHIAEVGAQWISENGDKLQALIDKFMKIDWASTVPKLFNGLTEFADKGLDNINKFLDRIPEILTTVRQTFNDLENRPLVKFLTGSGSVLSGITQTGAGIANIVAGAKLTSAGKTILSGLGATSNATLFGTVFGGASSFLAPLALIASTVVSILEVVKMIKSEDEQNEKFVESKETGMVVRDAIREYVSQIKLNESNRTGEQIYNINSLRDFLYSSTGGKLNLPMLDMDSSAEQFRSALKLAYEYYKKYYFSPTTNLGKTLQQRALDDILSNETDGIQSSAMALYEDMMKLWERFDNASVGYTDRLSKIDKNRARIQSMIEELTKKGVAWEIRTTSNFMGIYGDSKGKEGKYLSEKIKESFGGLFRNTTSDFAEVQEELTPKIKTLNSEMTKAIESYDMPEADKAKLYEAWANAISGIDPENEQSIAQLETMIKEGPNKLITTYLIPLMKSNEALNANKQALYEARLEALGLAGEDLDAQAEEIEKKMAEDPLLNGLMNSLVKMSNDFSKMYLPTINKGLISFGNDVRKSIQHLIDSINSWSFVAHPKVTVSPVRTSVYNKYLLGQGEYSANGGFMYPKGTDTIPAMLTPGEYVQRRAAVEHFGRMFMDRINALDLRGALRSLYGSYANPYATGGFVRSDNRSYRDNHAVVNQVFNSGNASTGFRRASRFVRALG